MNWVINYELQYCQFLDTSSAVCLNCYNETILAFPAGFFQNAACQVFIQYCQFLDTSSAVCLNCYNKAILAFPAG